MTYNEYEAIAKTITADNAPLVMEQILKEIKTDTETIESLTTSKAELESKVRDLQDTNIKLFLSQSTTPDPETPENEDAEVEAEIEKMLKGEK